MDKVKRFFDRMEAFLPEIWDWRGTALFAFLVAIASIVVWVTA